MKRSLPLIALLLSAVFWGIAIPYFKAADNIPPFSYALLRFIGAATIVTPIFLLTKGQKRVAVKDLPWLLIAALMGISINIGLLFVGVRMTNAVDAAVITNLGPLITVFASAIFLKEALTKHHVLGGVIALIGALIIVGEPLILGNLLEPQHLKGDALVVLSTLAWVAYTLLSVGLFKKYSPFMITTYGFIIGAVTFLPLAVWEYLQEPTWMYQLTFLDISSIVYYIFFGTIGAYFLYNWGLAKAGPDIASTTQHIIPLVSIAVAVMFLHESINAAFIAGAVLVFAGVFYSSSRSSRKR